MQFSISRGISHLFPQQLAFRSHQPLFSESSEHICWRNHLFCPWAKFFYFINLLQQLSLLLQTVLFLLKHHLYSFSYCLLFDEKKTAFYIENTFCDWNCLSSKHPPTHTHTQEKSHFVYMLAWIRKMTVYPFRTYLQSPGVEQPPCNRLQPCLQFAEKKRKTETISKGRETWGDVSLHFSLFL